MFCSIYPVTWPEIHRVCAVVVPIMDCPDDADCARMNILSMMRAKRCRQREFIARAVAELIAHADDFHRPDARRQRGKYRRPADIKNCWFEKEIMGNPSTVRRWLRMTYEQFHRFVALVEESQVRPKAQAGRPKRVTLRYSLGMLLLCMAHGEPAI